MTDRHAAVAACGLACLALALIIFIAARAPGAAAARDILASAPAAPTSAPPAAEPCALAGGDGAVSITGACHGAVGPFACVAVTDDLYLSARRPIDTSHVLYLTVNVESYHHRPGMYAGAQAFLQVTGPSAVATWSNRGFTAFVAADGSVALGAEDLAADPGTGATGTVSVHGTAGCAA